jgi:hypothetical protein
VNAGLTTTLFTSIVLHLLGLTALSMVSGSLRPVTPTAQLDPYGNARRAATSRVRTGPSPGAGTTGINP